MLRKIAGDAAEFASFIRLQVALTSASIPITGRVKPSHFSVIASLFLFAFFAGA